MLNISKDVHVILVDDFLLFVPLTLSLRPLPPPQHLFPHLVQVLLHQTANSPLASMQSAQPKSFILLLPVIFFSLDPKTTAMHILFALIPAVLPQKMALNLPTGQFPDFLILGHGWHIAIEPLKEGSNLALRGKRDVSVRFPLLFSVSDGWKLQFDLAVDPIVFHGWL